MEWIIVALSAVVIVMALSAMVIYLRTLRQEESRRSWYVEMWNIRHGYVLQLQFTNTAILGRSSPYEWGSGPVPLEADITVSAEHCMLYDDNGTVRIYNLSAVNPALINGRRMSMPVQLNPGDRLELGKSVFMVTRVVPVK